MDKLFFLTLSFVFMVQVALSVTTARTASSSITCGNLTCSHESKCHITSGSPSCNCHRGFKGDTCLEDVDECNIGNPCGHRGICHNTIGSYWCECLGGWNDTFHCDQNLTDVRECMPGWSGEWCQDQCYDDSSCSPTSYCKRLHSGWYRCFCKPGWTGRNCTDDRDECRFNPCRHSGTCINTIGSYMCTCANGWTGLKCEDIDICYEETPCSNYSTCFMANSTYHCMCVDGWQGINCTVDVNECNSTKCVHVESCANSIGSYSCKCTKGWQGDDCNERFNEGGSSSSTVGTTVGSSIGAFLVILAALSLLALLYKFKRKPSVTDMKAGDAIGNNKFKSQVNERDS